MKKREPISEFSIIDILEYCSLMEGILSEEIPSFKRLLATSKNYHEYSEKKQRKLEPHIGEKALTLCSKYGITFGYSEMQGTGERLSLSFYFLKEAPALLKLANSLVDVVHKVLPDIMPKGETFSYNEFEKAYYCIIAPQFDSDKMYTNHAFFINEPPSFCANIMVEFYEEMFLEEILHLKEPTYIIDETGKVRSPPHTRVDKLLKGISLGNDFFIDDAVLEEKAEIETLFEEFNMGFK